MGFRNIKIDSHVKLSIKNQQLNIETDIARQIPLEDINCIIIEKSDRNCLSLFTSKNGRYGNRGLCL